MTREAGSDDQPGGRRGGQREKKAAGGDVRILVFDSGLGGLSVLGAINDICRPAQVIYAADNAAFPYGGWREVDLEARLIEVMARLIEAYAPDVAVVACNTATTLALGLLRDHFDIPFIGTVPAIRVAARETRSKLVSILATPGTVRRGYTSDLIADFAAHCDVTLVGSDRLAAIAEVKLMGRAPSRDEIAHEIAPAFIERGGKRTDVVVLACTHYPFLLEELEAAAPWPVRFIDPAPAIARRTGDVLEDISTTRANGAADGTGIAVFTAPAEDGGGLARLLRRYGLTRQTCLALPAVRGGGA